MTDLKINPKLKTGWKEALSEELTKEYFNNLKIQLIEEYNNYQIFPIKSEIFNAFDCTPFNQVKVVILGQDPYHGEGQANGLSFSVNKGIRLPPSLKNIFKELQSDLDIPVSNNGDLSVWAKQGVLLLNATLTVRKGEPNAHQKIGWQVFTDAAIKKLNSERKGLIFMLWGNNAKKKKELIDQDKHHILESVHPSPFSARNGFFGCKHFSKTNTLLKGMNQEPIHWEIN